MFPLRRSAVTDAGRELFLRPVRCENGRGDFINTVSSLFGKPAVGEEEDDISDLAVIGFQHTCMDLPGNGVSGRRRTGGVGLEEFIARCRRFGNPFIAWHA